AVGLTFQQIQKYEKGANRIGASRLYQFARILDVPPAFFFDDMAEEGNVPLSGGAAEGLEEEAEPFGHDPVIKRETLEMVRAYYRIPDPSVRKRIFDMIKAIAGAADEA
ncbi:MAG: helix-turn-helix transcriptional regulator, partial [Alphaproteobacteria bacterium]|nr:helix-turn-helix transcriptional regulator [Alphaproteobacteria bacterium]